MSYTCLVEFVHHKELQRSVGMYFPSFTQLVYIMQWKQKHILSMNLAWNVFKVFQEAKVALCQQRHKWMLKKWVEGLPRAHRKSDLSLILTCLTLLLKVHDRTCRCSWAWWISKLLVPLFIIIFLSEDNIIFNFYCFSGVLVGKKIIFWDFPIF